MHLAMHESILTRLSAAVVTPPFEPQQNTVLTPGPEGRLVFSGFRVPAGVTVTFVDGAGDVLITSRGALTIDGTLDAGARSLTLTGESVTFGPAYSLTGSGSTLSINAPTFDPGPAGSLRGNVFLNGARLATGESLPGESYGVAVRFIQRPIADWSDFAISSDESTRFVQGSAAAEGTVSASGTGAAPWLTASTGRIELRDPVGTISNANSVVGSNGGAPNSLVLTALVAPPAPFSFASLQVTAVPEPGAWSLLLVGAAALLLCHRLRRDR